MAIIKFPLNFIAKKLIRNAGKESFKSLAMITSGNNVFFSSFKVLREERGPLILK